MSDDASILSKIEVYGKLNFENSEENFADS
jgi:hypothetical protein